MIAGFQCHELGGDPVYLDILGVNYYHANQWDLDHERLRWEDTPRDASWKPLSELLEEVYLRYKRPLFLAETSHFGVGRAAWLKETALEVLEAKNKGVPVEGICIYPILDRPDWDNLQHWHNINILLIPLPSRGNRYPWQDDRPGARRIGDRDCIHCAGFGMASNGNMNPDSNIDGRK